MNKQSFERLGYNLMTPALAEEEFVEEALKKLPEILDKVDRECIDNILRSCYNDRFTLSDAVRFARHTEEVSPELSESYACKVMNELMRKYVPWRCKSSLKE